MSSLIFGFTPDGVVTINRVILRPEHTVDDLQERVALLCENVKTYHSDTGFVGGFVALNSGQISNEGSTIGQAVTSPLIHSAARYATSCCGYLQAPIMRSANDVARSAASCMREREALIVTFWKSFEDHERSHRSETFQPLFRQVLELCENGNEEIAYQMLWSGRAYSKEEAEAARRAKQRFTSARAA